MGVVGPEGDTVTEEVPGDVVASVGSVDGGVAAERTGDPEAGEGAAVEDASAGAHLGGDVEVRVGEAEDRAVGVGADDLPPRVRGGLRVGCAALGGVEVECAVALAVTALEQVAFTLD